MTYAIHFNDEHGDLIDVEYYCCHMCYAESRRELEAAGVPLTGGGWPCGEETDYDVHCGRCGYLLWKGMESDA